MAWGYVRERKPAMKRGEPSESPPVFAGGLGGSGTRVVAAILRELHYHIGEDSNESLDNLWFTALFKRPAAWAMEQAELSKWYNVFRAASTGKPHPHSVLDEQRIARAMEELRTQHSQAWFEHRAERLLYRLSNLQQRSVWGWKEPNSHIVADRLLAQDPDLRYIHIARNGIYMAHSGNQNQLRLWGKFVFGNNEWKVNPDFSLRYWCWVERRAKLLENKYPGRALWIRYEDLCSMSDTPVYGISRLLNRPVVEVETALHKVVRKPARFMSVSSHDMSSLRGSDIGFVESLGFTLE